MRLLLVILLAASPLFAADAPLRPPYPDDYLPSPCAPSAEEICGGVKKVDFANLAYRFRGVTIAHDWIDAHWEEMKGEVFAPLCTKIANCYTIPGNTNSWCQNQLRDDFLATCERFPEGSRDREQCGMFATVYFITLGAKTDLHKRTQECATRAAAAEAGTLEAWIVPSTVSLDDDETFTLHAIDARRRVPVMARFSSDGGGEVDAAEGPHPTAGMPATWLRRLRRVPNADGHTDVVAPTLTVEAPGYATVRLPIPVVVPSVTVTMTPAASELREGVNVVTVAAYDRATGEPVEMRVMGGETVLGTTHRPFELVLSGKRPEIWLTSLFDRYSDVVVAK